MEKEDHAPKLRQAMARKGKSRTDVADAVGHTVRTVTNWTAGVTMPSDRDLAILRHMLGPYDEPGDPVEVAVRSSRLTDDRQHVVLGVYKRELREQAEAAERRRRA